MRQREIGKWKITKRLTKCLGQDLGTTILNGGPKSFCIKSMLPSIESMASKNEPHLSSSTDQKLCVDFAIHSASFEFFFQRHLFSIIYYTNFLESSLTAHKRVPAMLLRTSVANGPFAMRLSRFYGSNLGTKKTGEPIFLELK